MTTTFAPETTAVLPSSVLIAFPISYLDGSPVNPLNPPAWTETVPLSSVAGYEGLIGHPGSKIFHDTGRAFFASPGAATPTNILAIRKLAAAVARDFYDGRARSFDVVFNGILGFDPSDRTGLNPPGRADMTIFKYDGVDLTTRVLTAPPIGEPEELLHAFPEPNRSSGSSSSPQPSVIRG